MKKYLPVIAIALALIILIATPALADAMYRGTLRITNSGDSTATNVSVNYTLNSGSFIADGYALGDFSDVSIEHGGTPVPFMPGHGTNPWVTFVESIGGNANLDYTLYAKGATGGNIKYFPGEDGMTVPNTLAGLGNNFSIRLNETWLNTVAGPDKILFSHYDAVYGGIECFVSPTVDGTIIARIITVNVGSLYLLPNADGYYTNIAHETANPHYEQVDDPVGYSDNGTSCVSTGSTVQEKDAYNLQDPSFLGYNQVVTSVVVYFWDYTEDGNGYCQPYLRLGTDEKAGTEIGTGAVWAVSFETIARPGNGAWSLSDITSLQVAIGLRDGDGYTYYAQCTQVYVKVNYTYETYTDASATVVPSAEYDIIEVTIEER